MSANCRNFIIDIFIWILASSVTNRSKNPILIPIIGADLSQAKWHWTAHPTSTRRYSTWPFFDLTKISKKKRSGIFIWSSRAYFRLQNQFFKLWYDSFQKIWWNIYLINHIKLAEFRQNGEAVPLLVFLEMRYPYFLSAVPSPFQRSLIS